VGGDYAMNYRQAKSCALPNLLGREKGVENLAQRLGFHADACILHDEANVIISGLRDDPEYASSGHGLNRIHSQIEDHLLNLAGIRRNIGKILAQPQGDLDT
jgi:hypothetical protein